MGISNEDMEVLNRATEILSRYVREGGIQKETVDLYKEMVETAINVSSVTPGNKRIEIESPPFSGLVLSNVVGYYDTEGYPCFYSNPSLVNIVLESGVITFDVLDEETNNIMKELEEFTISFLLIVERNGELFGLAENKADDNEIEESKTIHAPFNTSLPIVFECKMLERKQGFVKTSYTAKVSSISVSESAMNNNGQFDIVKAWSNAAWRKLK